MGSPTPPPSASTSEHRGHGLRRLHDPQGRAGPTTSNRTAPTAVPLSTDCHRGPHAGITARNVHGRSPRWTETDALAETIRSLSPGRNPFDWKNYDRKLDWASSGATRNTKRTAPPLSPETHAGNRPEGRHQGNLRQRGDSLVDDFTNENPAPERAHARAHTRISRGMRRRLASVVPGAG